LRKKAIVLLSGGLDSAVTLFRAVSEGYDCMCLTFDYGQRHRIEISKALRIAKAAGAAIEVIKVPFPHGGSSLLDKDSALPLDRDLRDIKNGIPSTYVPARNTVFLSIAASFAEASGARTIFIGAHAEDSSGYPDCRRAYLGAFNKVLKLGTKAGGEGHIKVTYPLVDRTKAEIIKMGVKLKVPFELTSSCYAGKSVPCMRCDSCILRAKGFKEAGIEDPACRRVESKKRGTAEITDIFSSVQGEGIFVGARQIFVRFKDCNLDCSFCDEKLYRAAKSYTPPALAEKVAEIDLEKGPHHSVSLTGGEPLLYADFLKEFLWELKEKNMISYLETNGTLPKELLKVIDLVDIIAMDIKLPSSTNERAFWSEHEEFLRIASAKRVFVKAVVTDSTTREDIKRAIAVTKTVDRNIPFILQPAAESVRAAGEAGKNRIIGFLETALKNDLGNSRIVPQVHKTLGLK
jgi:7-cyano-7-deazaguanine synthase